jgi:Capsule polysaccharide biosynthesis protein
MYLTKYFVDQLKKTPLFIPARTAYSLMVPRLRALRREERADLKKMIEKCGTALQSPLFEGQGMEKSVLVMGMGRVRFIALEAAMRKSFELAGYRCQVIVPQDSILLEAYRRLGSDEMVFMDHFQAAMPHEGARMLEGCLTLDDVTALSVDGVRCGKYAVSTLMRRMRAGSFDLTNPSIREELARALDRSLQCTLTARALLQKLKPKALVLVDRGYSPSGELFDSCIENDIPVFTWNAAHRNDSLMLKRYTRANRDVHPSSLSEDSWRRIKSLPWSAQDGERVLEELERCYTSGEWYGEVGTQFNKKAVDKAVLVRQLGLDPVRKTVAIFPHIFWDATFFWGTDLFENYEEWFIETIKAACKNTAVNWVVKVHPANIVKNHRDGISAEHSEVAAIRRAIDELPPHVKLLEADTSISTLSLFKAIDACVTVRGTTGIEAACFGIPVLTAGTGRYDRLGFTLDSDSREEFLGRLADIQNAARLTPEQNELALKHAWGVLIGRPVSLQIFHMRYCNTKTADLEIEFLAQSPDELRQLADLKAMAAWICSGAEDFMDWSAH